MFDLSSLLQMIVDFFKENLQGNQAAGDPLPPGKLGDIANILNKLSQIQLGTSNNGLADNNLGAHKLDGFGVELKLDKVSDFVSGSLDIGAGLAVGCFINRHRRADLSPGIEGWPVRSEPGVEGRLGSRAEVDPAG